MRKDLELYVHIPFCVKKCDYCDFLSGPCDAAGQNVYMEALLQEIRLRGQKEARTGARAGMDMGEKSELYEVTSVFFGGGTPSIVEPEWIAKVMEEIRRWYALADDAEITLETNPGTLTAEKLLVYRQADLNRLSVGLQSADDEELHLLGRIHTWADFLESWRLIREAGFSNVNIDLMSALPGQTVESWRETLEKVCALSPEHISAYSLIIEEGTPFYERYGEADRNRLPSEEADREMYALTERVLAGYGYHRYEISNYAKAGKECRHNNGYWTGTEYQGFGIGAASYRREGDCYVRYTNVSDRKQYTEQLLKGQALLKELRAETETVTKENRMEEFFFLGLRRVEGVEEQEFFKRFQKTTEEVYGPAIKKLLAAGLLERKQERLRLTGKGIDVSNQVFVEFLL